MTEIIFAYPRHHFGSYEDVFGLVSLSGFSQCYFDEIRDTKDAVYVLFTPLHRNEGLVREGLVPRANRPKDRRAVIVHWHLERFDIGRADAQGLDEAARAALMCSLDYADAVWLSDKSLWDYAQKLLGYNAAWLQFVVYGGHRELVTTPQWVMPQRWDVCPLIGAVPGGRRLPILQAINAAGISIAPSGFGLARAVNLLESRAVLNLHQFAPLQPLAPARFTVAAAVRRPVLSEPCANPLPLVEGVHFLQAPAEELPQRIPEWLKDEDRLKALADNLHQLYCEEWPFRRGVEEGVGEVLRRRG